MCLIIHLEFSEHSPFLCYHLDIKLTDILSCKLVFIQSNLCLGYQMLAADLLGAFEEVGFDSLEELAPVGRR